MVVYVSAPLPVHPTPFPQPCPRGHSPCLRLDSCPADRFIWTTFSRFHIYDLTFVICVSLSDLLPSVWQTLGPSMSYKLPFTIRSKLYLGLIFFSFFPVSYVVWFKKRFSYKWRYSWPSTVYQKAMPFPTMLKYYFLLWIKWLFLSTSVLDSLTNWSNSLYLQRYHLALIFAAL